MKRQDLRHLKPYNPRKSRKELSIERQKVHDLYQLISRDLGAYLVLKEEGSEIQREAAKQKARSCIIKFAPELKKLATQVGERCSHAAESFIESADTILHAANGWLDEAKMTQFFHASERLEKELIFPRAA